MQSLEQTDEPVSSLGGGHQIKTAYQQMVKIHHPDRGGSSEGFNRVQRAYQTLYDRDKRRVYDEAYEAKREELMDEIFGSSDTDDSKDSQNKASKEQTQDGAKTGNQPGAKAASKDGDETHSDSDTEESSGSQDDDCKAADAEADSKADEGADGKGIGEAAPEGEKCAICRGPGTKNRPLARCTKTVGYQTCNKWVHTNNSDTARGGTCSKGSVQFLECQGCIRRAPFGR